LLVQSNPPTLKDGIVASGAKATIGSNILITVTDSGIVDISPKVAIFDVIDSHRLNLLGRTMNIFDSFDPVPVVLILENRGKNYIKPEGEITLKGAFGATSNYELLPFNIISRSQRLIEATPSASLITKEGRPVSLTVSGFFVGHYHLSTNISFGENSPTVFASTSFISFPFKLTAGFILVLIITVYIIKRFSTKD